MDLLKHTRTPLRGGFSKAATKLEELINSPEPNSEELAVSVSQLSEKFNRLGSVDEKIIECLQTDETLKATEDDFCAEIESVETYRDRFINLKTKAERLLQRIDCKHTRSENSDNAISKRKFKLPKIELKKFNGEITEWLGFWGQFKKIHDDSEIDPEDKFQYLIQSTEVGSRARDLVESFPPTSANYPKAIEYLKSRFGKDEMLVEVYVRELLSLVLSNNMNTYNRSSLSQLYDKIETHLRALETLGVATDKYAAMLYPLVEACLPEEVIRTWERSRGSLSASEDDGTCNKLQLLMKFLRSEVEGEERISLAKSGFGIGSSVNKQKVISKTHQIPKSNTPTAAGLLSESRIHKGESLLKNCIFCSQTHESQNCRLVQKWSLDDKSRVISQKGCCYTCLKNGHVSRKCWSKLICPKCHGRHYPIMCPEVRSEHTNKIHDKAKNSSDENSTNLANRTCTEEVLLQTLIIRLKGKEENLTVRAIVDTGSQRSYISKNAAMLMKYESLGQEKMTHSLFGGKESCETHQKYKMFLSNIENDYHCNFDVFEQQVICSNIPRTENGPWTRELKNLGIEVHDINYKGNISDDIQVLIGSDVAGKLFTGRILELKCGLVAMETRLGWTLMGKTNKRSCSDSSMLVLSLHVAEAQIADLWNLNCLGILDPAEKRNREELQEDAKNYFLKTLRRQHDGRYEVSLPWVEGHRELPNNRLLAEKRLKSTVKSLIAKDKLKAYENILKEWSREGIIEEVKIACNDEVNVHYLPHRAVFKENATTKIRPVFDGSAKMQNFPSLNDCLEKGPNLVELIPSILNRFRLGKFGVIADIRKAFLQISLQENDRNYLRFLWWEEGNPEHLKIYRHCRVVFGVSASPFLLGATLAYHLDNLPPHLEETSERLKRSLYVDNCVSSVDSEIELQKFINEAKEVMSLAKFDLRGWQWNSTYDFSLTSSDVKHESQLSKNLMNGCDTAPVLGLSWNLKTDTLSVDLRGLVDTKEEIITKRKILSTAHRIFDPIGFTCPVTLLSKIMLQKCWQLKISWDKELPEEIRKEYGRWRKDLKFLKDINIPRHVYGWLKSESSCSLHVFCDASKSAYATCIFLRVENSSHEVYCQLVQARTRVSPLKKVTIPRLELLACNIGARLYNSLKTDLDLEEIPTRFWTNSADALHWIKKPDSWCIFVANRVKEIRNLTNPDSWNFVPGTLNPADLPSRGCSGKHLLDSRWWEGPEWLKKPSEFWPKCDFLADPEIVDSEKRKTIISASDMVRENTCLFERISSYNKIVRVNAWIFRFYNNIRDKGNRKCGNLQIEELSRAERIILKYVQNQDFHKDFLQKLSMPTYIDTEGLLRVKSKISLRQDLDSFRYPILLPSTHEIVSKLIIQRHLDLNHAGVHVLMSNLRENYWILRTRKTIRHVIHECIRCKRFSSRPVEVVSAPLPEDRVRDASVFEIVGIDLAGPLYLKNGTKAWIVIFSCAVFRAIHLELTTSLSTNSFLLAFRRFISRRGRPNTVYSDQGTNFVGCNNEIKSLNWEKLQEYANVRKIKWKFNPPSAPWWGGFWERMIRLIKDILKRVLGKACLTYEELNTLLCDVESIINSRPLTYVAEDTSDLVALTPSMFLQEIRETGIPDLDRIEEVRMNKRFSYRQRIRDDLRKRFRSEYLGQLRQHKAAKDAYEIRHGDIVLVGSENIKRIEWPLARVVEVYPGKDGTVRLVKLKMKDGEYLRAVQRLYPLEINDEASLLYNDVAISRQGALNENTIPLELSSRTADVPEVSIKTRCGRTVKCPKRLTL